MAPKRFTIDFHYSKKTGAALNKTALQQFIIQQLEDYGRSEAEIVYIFCSDEEVLQINRQYLQHDVYTDIITFDLSEKKSSRLITNIYISVDRVKDNAKQLGIPHKEELHRVMFHGILHLMGFKDKSWKDRIVMREKENEWLNLYFTATS